jgi:hypothetical protein
MSALRLILFTVLATCCSGQSVTLTKYLSLTSQQATIIAKLNADQDAYVSTQNLQLNALQQQLGSLYDSPVPDPFAIGSRYVSIENINRDIAAKAATLKTQVAAKLTPAQIALLPGLGASLVLRPLAQDAECGFLLPPTGGLIILVSSTINDPNDSLGWFRQILPSPSTCGTSQFPIDVREYFNITDSQVSAFLSARASYNDYSQRQQNRTADLQVQIRDETAKASPDPNALGMLYVQLQAVNQEMVMQAAQYTKSAQAVLSADQTAKLTALQNTVALQSAAYQAMSCNMLTAPPASGADPSYGRCFF